MLDTQEKLFLDLYIANGLKPSKRVECYRLGFDDEAVDLQDSTVDTYAKTILAKRESKVYIEERKVNNSTATHLLMQNIKHLDKMLTRTQKLRAADEINIMKEKRQTVLNVAELVEIIKPSSSLEDKYIITDGSITIDAGYKLEKLTAEQALMALKTAGEGTFISIDRAGNIHNVTPLSNKHGKELRTAIAKGQFRLAIERISEQ